MAGYYQQAEKPSESLSPIRTRFPSLSPSPKKGSYPSTKSSSSLPKAVFQNELTVDIFNRVSSEYVDNIACAYQSQIYKSPSWHNQKLSNAFKEKAKFKQYFDKVRQSIAESRLNLQAEKDPSQSSLKTLESHFHVKQSYKPGGQKQKAFEQPVLTTEDIKALNRKRVMRYKIEKLEICQTQLQKIILEAKRKVGNYDRRKITLDIGL